MKIKNKLLSKYLIGILSITLLVVLSVSTYAWVKRDWSPSIEEDNLKIETSGALGIRLDDVKGLNTLVSVNHYVNANTFAFKQVSNCSGKSDDFFTLDYSKDIENPTLLHLDVSNSKYGGDYKEMGRQNGYIEFNFILYGNSSLTYKDIYIDEESLLRYNADDGNDPTGAMRISLSFNDNVQVPKHYVLTKKRSYHYGISNDKNSDGSYSCDGKNLKLETGQIDSSLNKDFLNNISDDNNKLITFGAASENYYGESNILYTMVKNQSINVTIRIWLEGTDPDCLDNIAGSKFDLKLVFNSHDHE